MSDEKVIHVPTHLFSIKTRKKPIKIKTDKPKPLQSTFKKNILRSIRDQVQKRQIHDIEVDSSRPSDFQDSVQFFKQLKDSKESKESKDSKDSDSKEPNTLFHSALDLMPTPPDTPVHMPAYSSMKNGSRPTYRALHNKTIKPLEATPKDNKFEQVLQTKVKNMSEQKQWDAIQTPKPILRQRRIKRRTFNIGKSSQYPQVSVLVSNQTIRNNTHTKERDLKAASMPEVKKHLLKHGLIKTGTNCPHDILREIYECANLICGEVHNRNSENLLYNYFNSKE